LEEDARVLSGVTYTVSILYIGSSAIIVICGYITISVLWGNVAYCVTLSGEDLSGYSNKTESVGLIKCPYCRYLTKKVVS